MSTTTSPDTPTTGTGRHRVDVAHLVMGLVLLGVVGAWALAQTGTVSDGDLRWLLPLPWLVGGAAGLVAIAVGALRRQRPAGTTDTETHTHTDTHTSTELTDELMTEEDR